MRDRLDFNTLSLRDTLDLAIELEEEARERYHDFAEQMRIHHTPEVADFFGKMVVYEAMHATRLRQRRQQLFGDEPSTLEAGLLIDAEAPEIDRVRAFMSVREALEVAFDSEVKAYGLYESALAATSDPDLQTLFTDLRDEEKKHQELIEAEIARHPDDSGYDPDDFVDEPVGI
jgi:rubrerythrin